MTQIKVGDTFFVFDENRRVYNKSARGECYGAPIYREHFRPTKITGETSRSWVIDWFDKKIPKSAPWAILNTAEMVEDKVWLHVNRYKISNTVGRMGDVTKLRKIADLLGYEAEP